MMHRIFVLTVVTSVAAHAAADTFDYGDWVAYGLGEVRTVVQYDSSLALSGYGFEMTDLGLATPGATAMNLEFDAAGIPIDHVSLSFQPAGHPGGPGDTYWATPHFDFHFFALSVAARAGMTDATTAYITPNAANIPTGYVEAPNSFATGEGAHWFDPGEFAGGPPFTFTKSSIYGFYDGQMTFVEPMISQAYLQSLVAGAPGVESLATPELFPVAGMWPTGWTASNNGGGITIMMDGLTAGVVPGPGIMAMLGFGAMRVSRRRRR